MIRLVDYLNIMSGGTSGRPLPVLTRWCKTKHSKVLFLQQLSESQVFTPTCLFLQGGDDPNRWAVRVRPSRLKPVWGPPLCRDQPMSSRETLQVWPELRETPDVLSDFHGQQNGLLWAEPDQRKEERYKSGASPGEDGDLSSPRLTLGRCFSKQTRLFCGDA